MIQLQQFLSQPLYQQIIALFQSVSLWKLSNALKRLYYTIYCTSCMDCFYGAFYELFCVRVILVQSNWFIPLISTSLKHISPSHVCKIFFPFLPPSRYLGLTFVSDLLYFVALVGRRKFHVIRINRPAVNDEHKRRTQFCRGDESLGLKIRDFTLPLKGGDHRHEELPRPEWIWVASAL